jgi:hypothetical protein
MRIASDSECAIIHHLPHPRDDSISNLMKSKHPFVVDNSGMINWKRYTVFYNFFELYPNPKILSGRIIELIGSSMEFKSLGQSYSYSSAKLI